MSGDRQPDGDAVQGGRGKDLTRRELIKVAAATLGAPIAVSEALASAAQTSAGRPAAAPTFFTPEELALVDELSELIIPADDHSPGARAARVAAYIDARLAEAWDGKDRASWRAGLRAIEQLSREAAGKPFMQSSADERTAVLTRIARNEGAPKTPEENFFATLKSAVVHAYYTSSVGIKQEMEYKGNSYLPEFVGADVS